MAFPAANSRRIFNTVSNTNIPISPPDIRQARSLDHQDEGSFFDADHPATGVPFPRRSTAEWISDMFCMEETDRKTLENPRASIIDAGGAVLFVEAAGMGIIGTCALQKTGTTGFELTKMGVRKAARGLKAGEFLLNAVIHKAQELGADPLYLLTNRLCAAAIHLYEKLGFRHDAAIMAHYGARYARCDVAMRYVETGKGAGASR